MYFGYTYETGMRSVNQDALLVRSCLLSNGELTLALVCDGMGGEEHGEKASYVCVNALDIWFDRELVPIFLSTGNRYKKRIKMIQSKGMALFRKINDELFSYMRINGEKMGTTASFIIVYRNEYYIFHIGDSRIYKIYSFMEMRWIQCVTNDHAKGHCLTRCLGLNRDYQPDYLYGKTLCRSFLLCTDGFWHLYQKDIWNGCFDLNKLKNSVQINKRLMELATDNYKKGEKDNSSALMIINR